MPMSQQMSQRSAEFQILGAVLPQRKGSPEKEFSNATDSSRTAEKSTVRSKTVKLPPSIFSNFQQLQFVTPRFSSFLVKPPVHFPISL